MNPQPQSLEADSKPGGSVAMAWLYVGVPLLWGVSQTFLKALTLFK